MSDNMPDFDNMTQEEITAWLETLAKRQGASEGFTTAADMDIAEVDPDTVVIDEPGYIPYGQETAQARPQQPVTTQITPPAPVQPPEPLPAPPVQPIAAPEPVYAPPAAEQPPISVPEAPPVPQPEPAAPVEQGGLAWLASLAADQDEEIFNLDLSDLPANTSVPAEVPAVVNPMTWLEDLARAQVAEPSLEHLGADDDDDESEKLNPYTQNADPMEWLETLAKRQGADPDELTTGARMKIPAADEAEVEEPGYEPFSFDTPPSRRAAEPVDTANWLSSLAGAEGYSESGVLATQPPSDPEPAEDISMSAIEDALNAGTVTPDQMQRFLDQQAEQLAAEPDEEYEIVDEDAPLAPAELPDWLSDLKPEPAAPTAEPTKPLDALFETPAVPEMPDWLRQDMLGDEALTLASIFDTEDESSQPFVAITDDEGLGYEVEVDASDPWVEAFDLEYEQGGAADADSVPAWYEQNLNDPARVAAVEGEFIEEPVAEIPIPLEDIPAVSQVALEDAALPDENDLPVGQPQEVPAWAGAADIGDLYSAAEDQYDEQFVEEAAAFEADEDYGDIEIPDWLKEVETTVSPEDVPAWLVQTIAGDSADVVPEPEPEPVPVVVQPPVSPPAPAYTPPAAQVAAATSAEAAEVLTRARDKEQSGDLEGALVEYEAMVRGSVDLDAVVADLTQLTKSYKTTPAVFRVLGDGLMRQGKLQAALNTYREALNQL